MQNIDRIFKALGLADSERDIYLSLFESGPANVATVSKNTNLSRQAVYNAIDVLTEVGIITSVMRDKKKFYAAEDPEKLLAYGRRKETAFRDQLKELEGTLPEMRLKKSGDQPTVKLYEGKEGTLTALSEFISENPVDAFEIADVDAHRMQINEQDFTHLKNVLKKNNHIHLHGLYAGTLSENPTLKVDRYRLPKELSGFGSNIIIYNNTILLTTFEGKIHSIAIENAALSKAFKILFTLAFENAKKEKFPFEKK